MISWTGCGALWRTWLWWEGSEEPHHPSYHHNLPAPQLCQHTTIVVWFEWRCGEVVWRVGEKNRQRFCSTVRSVKFCDRDLAVVLPPPGGGVWVLDWLWCCGGRGCGVEGSVVVPHHPSYHNLPAPPSTPPNHVPWWWCGCCVVEVVVWRVGEEVLRDKETKGPCSNSVLLDSPNKITTEVLQHQFEL